MIKYKYNITFERVDIIGKHYGYDYTTIEASNFDSVVKKFKEQYENCEIIAIIRL